MKRPLMILTVILFLLMAYLLRSQKNPAQAPPEVPISLPSKIAPKKPSEVHAESIGMKKGEPDMKNAENFNPDEREASPVKIYDTLDSLPDKLESDYRGSAQNAEILNLNESEANPVK